MKKKIILSTILGVSFLSAQFKINIEASDTFSKNKVIVSTIEGSKYIPVKEVPKKNGKWMVEIPKNYMGMMRIFFPENGKVVNFISENKDIHIRLTTDGDKILQVDFLDESNQKMIQAMQSQRRKDQVLPALLQIKKLYNDNSVFDKALNNEIFLLENSNISIDSNPFIQYYLNNNKLLASNQDDIKISTEEYIRFFTDSSTMLESSSLLRPALVSFLRKITPETMDSNVDKLLERADLKTSRGQLILSELLSIFEIYEMDKQKEKYFNIASGLTNVNGQLKNTTRAIKNTSIGAVFPDYSFTSNVTNTRSKKLSSVKADKKVILFWSSTCSHCLSELPIIFENYQKLKQKNIEVVAFALDNDAKLYKEKTKSLPWINDTEMKGWQSSYTETYNVRATPTYFILDKDNKVIEKPRNFSVFLSTIE